MLPNLLKLTHPLLAIFQLLNNIIKTIIPIRRRKEIANVGMRVIMRICSATNAPFNAPNCP